MKITNIAKALRHPIQTYKQIKALSTTMNALISRQLGQQAVWLGDNREEYIHKGYLYNADVYSVVNLIIRSAVRIPWVLYEVKDEKSFRRYRHMGFRANNRPPTQTKAIQHKALEEVDDQSHQIYQTWDQPNALEGRAEFLASVLGYRLTIGESYIHGVGPTVGQNKGQYHNLIALPSHLMRIQAKEQAIQRDIDGFYLDIGQEARNPSFEPEEILHLKMWNPEYSYAGTQLYGVSPMRAGRREVTRNNDIVTASVKFLQNMGAIGILSPEDSETVGADDASQLNDQYQQKYGGPHNYGRIIVNSHRWSWTEIGKTAKELGLESQEWHSLRKVCNLYNVPSQLLNDPDNKTYNNEREARKALINNVVIPELELLRDELNRWWIPGFENGSKLFFDFDAMALPELQEDLEKQVKQLSNAWWLRGNEKRIAMGYDEDPNPLMETYHIPAGLVPASLNESVIEDAEKRLLAAGVEEYQSNGHE